MSKFVPKKSRPRQGVTRDVTSVTDVSPDIGLHVYADGCCEPNPGAGGWAFVAYQGGVEIASANGGVEHSTNNAMELVSVLRALEWIASNAAGVPSTVWSDSTYAVNGCNNWRHVWKNRDWKKKALSTNSRNRAVANLELWQAIDAVLVANPQITIAWCKGHSGIPGNERADRLADAGRCSLDPDAGFRTADTGLPDLDAEYRAIMGGVL